jgi:transposase InsO family protein
MTIPLTKKQYAFLYDLYYNKKYLFGRDRIYSKIKDEEMNISKQQIQDFLNSQEINQLYKPTQQTKNIQNTILKEPNKQVGIDIIDMTKYENNNKKYIFTAIDLFSKKAYAYAMNNKSDCYKYLSKLINDIGHKLSSIRSDNGSEFIADNFKKILTKHNIKQVFSLPSKPQSNGNIERFNQTLKKLIKMDMRVNNNYDWPNSLNELVDNYNNTIQDTTNKIPNDINENEFKEINENISNKILKGRDNNNDVKFELGDSVRLKLKEPDDYGMRWSKQIYIIMSVNVPKTRVSTVFYTINNKTDIHYYNNDVQLIKKLIIN